MPIYIVFKCAVQPVIKKFSKHGFFPLKAFSV